MATASVKRVFIMDDSAFALEIVRRGLDDATVNVTCGRDLSDLSRMTDQPVDLVLMDVEMPEAYGDDVAAVLLAEGLSSPVYLLSGLPDEVLEERAQECGASGYIPKRLGVGGVIARVRAILATDGPGPTAPVAPMIADFLSSAWGRLRRVEAALGQDNLAIVSGEFHTLAGEAALMGLSELAEAALAWGADAAVLTDENSPEVDAALRATIAKVAAELTTAAERAHQPVRARRAGRSARLLLLDDSDFFRSTLMALLEDCGYVVVEARRLSEARHRMHEGRYDLAILDLHLGDGRGSDLIPELREHAPGTPLLLLSGDASSRHDADLVLPKSVDPDELVRHIDELLAAARNPAA